MGRACRRLPWLYVLLQFGGRPVLITLCHEGLAILSAAHPSSHHHVYLCTCFTGTFAFLSLLHWDLNGEPRTLHDDPSSLEPAGQLCHIPQAAVAGGRIMPSPSL
jgi:hypothetical protein